MQVLEELVGLARALGQRENDLVILAEGNCSAKDADGFWVKASGAQMARAESSDFVRLSLDRVLAALDEPPPDDRAHLDTARLDPAAPRASTEAFMHAWLLTLPDVRYVGHTHPPNLLAILATDLGRQIAPRRLFPDEVVFCGAASCWVPYVMPGLPLARAIREAVTAFRENTGAIPTTIWLQNHGLIALGGTANEVLAASLMAEKAARIWRIAHRLGEVRPLTKREIDEIAGWPDEHYRKQRLSEER
jgi:rhamnose utilization protein RhaD (predicted bifunctional aldolase and dehydrogenase)